MLVPPSLPVHRGHHRALLRSFQCSRNDLAFSSGDAYTESNAKGSRAAMSTPPFSRTVGAATTCHPRRRAMASTPGKAISRRAVSCTQSTCTPLRSASSRSASEWRCQELMLTLQTFNLLAPPTWSWSSELVESGPGCLASPILMPRRPRLVAAVPATPCLEMPRPRSRPRPAPPAPPPDRPRLQGASPPPESTLLAFRLLVSPRAAAFGPKVRALAGKEATRPAVRRHSAHQALRVRQDGAGSR
mmetsp:Transcript_54958/g.178613  ORF Transcript_54958/g.178613 Transcript_54958/m.178613 type:complete len:245 (-) Transcript_54958:90-824(-)